MDEDRSLEQFVNVTLGVDVYLINKDDPLRLFMTMRFNPNSDECPSSVEELTDFFSALILQRMDMHSQIAMLFEDDRYNKTVVYFDQIQAIHITAPDELPETLRGETDDV